MPLLPPAKSTTHLNLLFIILILILLLLIPVSIAVFPKTTRASSIRKESSSLSSEVSTGALRRTRHPNRTVQDCSYIGSRSGYLSSSSRCKWCRSDAVDDFCFSKAEAWRLPSQVFTCE